MTRHTGRLDIFDLLFAIGLTVVVSIPLAISVWALLDVAHRPQWAWSLADRNQAGWMVAILLGTFTVVGGLLVSGLYLARIRPQIRAAENGEIT